MMSATAAEQVPAPGVLGAETAPRDTDADLLRRFAAGDGAALGALASRYEGAMMGLAVGMLSGNRDLARDALQETWLRVIRHAKGYRGEASVKTWIYRILVNRCINARAVAAKLAARSGIGAEVEPGASELRLADEHEPLRCAVDSLSEDVRTLLLLCYHRGLSHAEAAQVLGIPPGTLKSRLHTALTALRERLGKDER
ncbi:MAG TPA: RNA polymerase sigma factor [Phycisphaerales bacterium]|nr:RNA polymerase sigma factor [Phycisphaerales bacterium]